VQPATCATCDAEPVARPHPSFSAEFPFTCSLPCRLGLRMACRRRALEQRRRAPGYQRDIRGHAPVGTPISRLEPFFALYVPGVVFAVANPRFLPDGGRVLRASSESGRGTLRLSCRDCNRLLFRAVNSGRC
jgi:hypothetical protein